MTNLSSPLVSILIANYNNKKFLKKCITSCLNQNYKNIEIIIFDDCSTDDSQNFLRKFRKKKNIKILYNKKKKLIPYLDAMNAYFTMFNKSKGKYIFFLDSDDFFFKNKISQLTNFFIKNNNVKFIQEIENVSSIKTNFILSRWPKFSVTSCISVERNYFKEFIKFNNLHKDKYPNVWLDFRICSYSFFKKKNFYTYTKKCTFYNSFHDSNVSKKYSKFGKEWFFRRYFSHKYINSLKKTNFSLSIDFIFTKFIYKIIK